MEKKKEPRIFVAMVEKELSIEKVEQTVCSYFGVRRESLYEKQGKHIEARARHFLWYILHAHCGMSNAQIARKYIRSERATLRFRSDVKFLIENVSGERKIYEEIIKRL